MSVSSEVKKLKKEKELKWRFEGHEIQFVFNTELEDGLKQLFDSIVVSFLNVSVFQRKANRIFMYFCIKSRIGTQGEVS